MENKNKLTKKTNHLTRLVQLSLLVAIMIILAITPLGFIPLGFTRATTLHIPVIIGAVLMGPMYGGILGGCFGTLSMIINTITPTATSFVFSPFYSLGEVSGGFYSILICFLPRILIGVVAGYIFKLLSSKTNTVLSASVAGLLGSLTNTFLVLGGIYFLFGNEFANVIGKEFAVLGAYIGSIILINGVPEAIVAAILVGAIVPTIIKLEKRNSRGH